MMVAGSSGLGGTGSAPLPLVSLWKASQSCTSMPCKDRYSLSQHVFLQLLCDSPSSCKSDAQDQVMLIELKTTDAEASLVGMHTRKVLISEKLFSEPTTEAIHEGLPPF